MDRTPLTQTGADALRAELTRLKKTERPRIVAAIEEARAHGDLKENAEYHAAKERQGLLDAEMRTVEDQIARAQVIDPATIESDKVVFGATVALLNIDTDEEVTYQLVGADEADLKEGTISYISPLGRALIGKEEGDDVLFNAPGGARNYEVIEIRFE